MTQTAPETFGGRSEAITGRIDAIDLLRGGALVAMAIYHFTWDLEFFGYVLPGLTQVGGWKLFARTIASTFLVLVGVSLFLAHGNAIRWRGFRKRLFQIAAAAAAITLVTWYAMPERFIFFGILHQIALASVLGLLFLSVPWPLLILAGISVIAAPHFLRSEFFDHPALWWVGLSSSDPPSNDYVPVFPWTGAVLLGIALAQIGVSSGAFRRLGEWRAGRWARPIRLFGHHGIAFYLVHQPVLIACLWLFALAVPAEPETPASAFLRTCQQGCVPNRGEEYCSLYCVCVLDGITSAGKLEAVFSHRADSGVDEEILEIVQQCRVLAEPQTGTDAEP